MKLLIEWIKDNFKDEPTVLKAIWESIKDTIGYFTPRFVYRAIRFAKYGIPDGFSRMFYGYSSVDWHNIGDFVTRNCLPMLKKLRNKGYGHPQNMTKKQWEKILDTIIEGFELNLLNMSDIKMPDTNDDIKWLEWRNIADSRDKKIQKANELFGKHLHSLWD